jgi:hypothetical protein
MGPVYTFLSRKYEALRELGKPRNIWDDNAKTDLKIQRVRMWS